MRNYLFVLFISVIGLGGCSKEVQPLTPEQIRQKIDSITAIRVKQSDEMARIDLERRMKIEVKVKADSILNAQQQAKAADTIKRIPAKALPGKPVLPSVPVRKN